MTPPTVQDSVAPVVTVKADPHDPDQMTVRVTVDNHGDGAVKLDWGQTPALPDGSNPGDNRTPTTQKYAVAGSWTITATNLKDPQGPKGTAQVVVPTPRPVVTVEQDETDPTRMSVLVTVDNHGNGPVIVAWGQTPVLPTAVNPGDGTTKTKKKYTVGGTWTVTATDIANAYEPIGTAQVTVPFAPPQEAPDVTVFEDQDDATGMTVQITADNHGFGDVNIDWGQTPALPAGTNNGDGRTRTSQAYTAAGTWTITVTDADNPEALPGTATVKVPLPTPQPAPTLTVSENPDDTTGMTVDVKVDNNGHGPCTIHWGQTPALPDSTNPGDGTTKTTQQYTATGAWTITVQDADNQWAPVTTQDITLPLPTPQPAPTVTPSEDQTDTTGMTIILVVDNNGHGPVTIDWGQNPALADGTNPGDGTTTTTQQYTTAGTWTITVQDTDNRWAPPATLQVDMPLPTPQPAPTLTVTENPDDATGMTVDVKVDNNGNGPVVLDWGQTPALATADNPGDGTTKTTQQYTAAGMWTITAQDKNNKWAPPATADITVPLPTPQPAPTLTVTQDPADTTNMTVDVTVDNNGNGPVTIDWGQTPALAAGTNPGDGTTKTTQQYTTDGTWTIVVRDADNKWAPPATFQLTVPMPAPQPAPTLTVSENPDDATGMTVDVKVDNHSNGAVTIDWGQTPALAAGANPGDGTTKTTQQYTTGGTWTIVVQDADNKVAPPATFELRLPLPAPQPAPTLTAHGDPSDATGMTVLLLVDNNNVPCKVDWGQTPPLDDTYNLGDGVNPSTAIYTTAGTWTITATDARNKWAPPGTVDVTVPILPAPTLTPSMASTDPTRMTVHVLADSHSLGPVKLDYGDGSDPDYNMGDGQNPSAHQYTANGDFTITGTLTQHTDAPPATAPVTVPWPENFKDAAVDKADLE